MYSIVLMAAMTTGVDMPDWGRRWGCWGCWGCYGGCWGCYGGYGWGWGGHGWRHGWGGYGWGGYGWGGYGWGGYGWGGWGAYGAWGGWSGWGYAAAPVYSSYATPVLVSNAPLVSTTQSMYYDPAASNRATLIVHLPANARLLVDGKPTTSTSSVRRFYTPPLEAGENYHYDLRAEMNRNGETVTTTKRVAVRPGKTEEVYLKFADLDERSERPAPPSQPAERKGIPPAKGKIDRP